MIFVIIACAIAWKYISGRPTQKILRIAIIGIIVTGLTTAFAVSLPITDIPMGSEQELRVMPPTAFPLTMQQYRDYDTDKFSYRIVIGWPDGIPIFQGITYDDQSEYIHLAHLSTGILLGGYMIVGLVSVLLVIYLVEIRKAKTEGAETNTGS